MTSECVIKMHRLQSGEKDGAAALMLAREFVSDNWLAEEIAQHKNDWRFNDCILPERRKEGARIAVGYFRQAFDWCGGVDKLIALVGLTRCEYGEPAYEFPAIESSPSVRNEYEQMNELFRSWSCSYEDRLKKLAACADGRAKSMLAIAAEFGLRGLANTAAAEKEYEEAIKCESPISCWRLGLLYEKRGNLERAKECYLLGDGLGSEISRYLLGRQFRVEGEKERAVPLLASAAYAGVGGAWAEIAELLSGENETKVAEFEVASCYKFAVRYGYPDAYDWLMNNIVLDSKKTYHFSARRKTVIEEFSRAKCMAQISCFDAKKCFDAYKYLIQDRGSCTYGSPKKHAIRALERAVELGCADAMYELAKNTDPSNKNTDIAKDEILAVIWYRKGAELGNARAMREFAKCFRDGRVMPRDEKLFAQWIVGAAEGDDFEAQLVTADLFEQGVICERNEEEALRWYRTAFGNNSIGECNKDVVANGFFHYGRLLEQHVHLEDAGLITQIYERAAADFDSADAYWRLGELHESGKFGCKSVVKAAECYCKSLFVKGVRRWYSPQLESFYSKFVSKHRNDQPLTSGAAYCLTLAYGYDVGVNEDGKEKSILLAPCPEQARKWYRAAMEAGSTTAAWRYAEFCESGLGGAVAISDAESAYTLAAKSDRIEFSESLAEKYETNVFNAANNVEQALCWLQRGVALGSRKCAYNLGRFYHKGIGLTPDVKQAIEWYRKSGYEDAYLTLARMFCAGEEVPKDVSYGLKCYSRCTSCVARLEAASICYEYGHQYDTGLPTDVVQCVMWYSKAASLKHAKAQFRLAQIFEDGIVVRRDLYRAAKWYYWASENGIAAAKTRTAIYCELGLMFNFPEEGYVRNLYEQAAAGGDELAKEHLAELDAARMEVKPLSPSEGAVDAALNNVEFHSVGAIVELERSAVANVVRRGAGDSFVGLFRSIAGESAFLQKYVKGHCFCEIDFPERTFDVAFNECRKTPVLVDYYDRGEDWDPPGWDMASPEELGQQYPNEGY